MSALAAAACVSPDEPMLSIDALRVSYGNREVVSGASLIIHKGETFGLVGLNGAGKTTIIKTVLGLRQPQGGGIRILGRDALGGQGREHVAFLPERFDPPTFLKGIEFLRFSLKLNSKTITDDEARTAAQSFALDPNALFRRIGTYSKGMRQKLGLMATLLTNSDLTILDEPMSGLDPLARALVKNNLRKAKAAGHTIFLSSHILADMDEICDRVGVFHNGNLVFVGLPHDMKATVQAPTLEQAFLKMVG
jgi:ABC-2 type transport system ATP-binding protein